MKKVIVSFIYQALATIAFIAFMFFIYVFFPRQIDLVVINGSEFDVTYVTVSACDMTFKFPLIKRGESEVSRFSPSCEGSYDVLYLNGNGELVSSKNLGYITTHLYAKDTVNLLNDRAVYIIGRRVL